MYRVAVALVLGAAVGFVYAADDKPQIQGGIVILLSSKL
jgi:hypothetical protein